MCQVYEVMCYMSLVICRLLCVTCQLSTFNCHMSKTPTVTAPPPARILMWHGGLVRKDPKTQKIVNTKNIPKKWYADISNTIFKCLSPVHQEVGFPGVDRLLMDIATYQLNRASGRIQWKWNIDRKWEEEWEKNQCICHQQKIFVILIISLSTFLLLFFKILLSFDYFWCLILVDLLKYPANQKKVTTKNNQLWKVR